jgi:hypothetical protein
VLVWAQFFSPASSTVNAGISDDPAFRFKPLALVGNRIRPAGPFTSDAGLASFHIVVVAFAVASWILPRARRAVALPVLVVGTAAVLVSLGLSGSRGGVLHSALVVSAAVGCAAIMRGGASSLRALFFPSALIAAAIVLYPILLPAGHEAFSHRWAAAAAAESGGSLGRLGIFGRFLYNFFDFAFVIGQTPLLGYGLGLGGNARLLLGIELEDSTVWAETDWSRHIIDLGPVFGVAYIVLRVALVAWLAAQAVRALRGRGDPTAALLLWAAGFNLLSGQITGQGTINGFTWIFCGFALAAARGEAPAAVAPPEDAAPKFPNLLR